MQGVGARLALALLTDFEQVAVGSPTVVRARILAMKAVALLREQKPASAERTRQDALALDSLRIWPDSTVVRESELAWFRSPPRTDLEVIPPQETFSGGLCAPRFPAALRAAGVDGRVVLEFSVRVDGTVDTTSVTVVQSSDTAFTRSVRASLSCTRLTPGRIGGEVVEMRTQKEYAFAIEGGPVQPAGRVGPTAQWTAIARALAAKDDATAAAAAESLFVDTTADAGLRTSALQVLAILRHRARLMFAADSLREMAHVRDSSRALSPAGAFTDDEVRWLRLQTSAADDYAVFVLPDEPALADPDRPPPVLPSTVRISAREAVVLLKFIVSRNGVVRKQSIEVLRSNAPEAHDALREIVGETTFLPGVQGGNPVWSQVQQEFRIRRN
jgi:outer membrane biosynthesis protein TonB